MLSYVVICCGLFSSDVLVCYGVLCYDILRSLCSSAVVYVNCAAFPPPKLPKAVFCVVAVCISAFQKLHNRPPNIYSGVLLARFRRLVVYCVAAVCGA